MTSFLTICGKPWMWGVMVSLPARGAFPVLAATEYLIVISVPVDTPDAGAAITNHDTSLCTLQAQPAGTAIMANDDAVAPGPTRTGSKAASQVCTEPFKIVPV